MKKTLSITCILASMLLSMAACGDTDTPITGDTAATPDPETTAEEVLTFLPEGIDYGGEDYVILDGQASSFNDGESEVTYKLDDIETGDIIAEAVYERTRLAEETLNIRIINEQVFWDQLGSTISKSVSAGDSSFEAIIGRLSQLSMIVPNGCLLDLNAIETLDLTNEWWDPQVNTSMTVGGKQCIASGSINYYDDYSITGMAFNKKLFAMYDIAEPYDLVREGKWTFEAFYEIVNNAAQDINGDSQMDENDFYGFYHDHGSCLNTYLWSFDNPICKKDAEGVPQIVVKTDKIDSIVSGLYDFLNNTQGVYYNTQYYNEKGISYKRFLERKSIFCTSGLSSPTGEGLRNFEDDYGILPYPKYDESQEKYMTMADGIHTVLAVPKTVKDTEFVGIITEALSAETWKTVTPTLYEIALKTRYLRDSESKEVLDLVIDGRTFDFGYVYGGSQGFTFMLQSMMADGKSNFSSYYDSRYKMARLHYKSVVKAFDKI